jgi:hypothetical protein
MVPARTLALCEDHLMSAGERDHRGVGSAVSTLVPGVLTALTAGLLGVASLVDRPVLALILVPVQAILVITWLVSLSAPAAVGGALVAGGGALVADAIASFSDVGLRRLAAVIAVCVLLSLAHQLVRRDGRPGVTASLAATVGAVALLVGGSVLVALRVGAAGSAVVQAALAAAAAGGLVARALDAARSTPSIGGSPRRGWLGLVLGIAAGSAAAALVGAARTPLGVGDGFVLGAAVTFVLLAFELGVDLARTAVPHTRETVRVRSALIPLSVVLPLSSVGPTAYVAGRMLLG